MKSPFPGMDPYLESRWPDVHAKLVAFIGETLQPRLPSPLRARSEERVVIESDDPERPIIFSYRSDIAIVNLGGRDISDSRAPSPPGTATLEPIAIEFYADPDVDRSIHIIDTSTGNRVITAIEILSPANKGPGRPNKEYLKKLDDYDAAEVNIVEIDLLRDPGRGRLPISNADLPPERRAPYMVCVHDVYHRHQWLVYPVSLRTPLPAIPIPLRRTDAPVQLDLQPLIERVYVAGGHDDIDYKVPPNPPLHPIDVAWADELLRQAGRK